MISFSCSAHEEKKKSSARVRSMSLLYYLSKCLTYSCSKTAVGLQKKNNSEAFFLRAAVNSCNIFIDLAHPKIGAS